jgi:hypothetical protein
VQFFGVLTKYSTYCFLVIMTVTCYFLPSSVSPACNEKYNPFITQPWPLAPAQRKGSDERHPARRVARSLSLNNRTKRRLFHTAHYRWSSSSHHRSFGFTLGTQGSTP